MEKEEPSLAKRVSSRLRAGALVVIVQEPDELVAVAEVKAACDQWSPVQIVSVTDPECADKLEKHSAGRGTLILLDFLSVYGENNISVRMIRQVSLQSRPEGDTYSRLVLIEQPFVKIPLGLSGDCELVPSKLPSVKELTQELEGFVKARSIKLEGNGEVKYSIASAVTGLARHEASMLFARSWVEEKKLDPEWLRLEKARKVTQRLQGALTFEKVDASDVGGLDMLKTWLSSRKTAFSSNKAREWGLPEPKGLLLLGVPGGGKSLTARCIAREWGLPLLRLDAGRLFGSLVGQSESQTRQAIEAAEACSPCVLWIDEIEKGLSGTGGLDGGTSSRVFGAILTWLQEKTSPVFVIATANRIKALPPELLRKGRFDEIFYVGLPDALARREIIEIHVRRRKRTLTQEDVNILAEATEGFSGAELEQAVVDALFTAWSENAREITRSDVLNAVKATTPLSKTMREEINEIEAWASTRARQASSRGKYSSAGSGSSSLGDNTSGGDDVDRALANIRRPVR